MKRSAFTLVELSVSMTAGTAMIILAVSLVQQSMSLAKVTGQRSDHLRSLGRLAAQFRSDVHQARTARLMDDRGVRLVMDDSTEVLFLQRGDVIVRTRRAQQDVVHQDRFATAAGTECNFRILEDPSRVVLTVFHPSGQSEARMRIQRETVAVLSRRLMHQQGKVFP